MESEAIDPVDFREAQHKHWDSAAVGWKEWSEFNDRAARRREPGRGLGRDHASRGGCGERLGATELLKRGAARFGNRLASDPVLLLLPEGRVKALQAVRDQWIVEAAYRDPVG